MPTLDIGYHYDVLMRFIVDNGLVASVCGFTLGAAIATGIRSFVADVMMPFIYKIFYVILLQTPLHNTQLLNLFFRVTELDLDMFIKEVVNMILIIVCTYFLLTKVIQKYLDQKEERDRARVTEKNTGEGFVQAPSAVKSMLRSLMPTSWLTGAGGVAGASGLTAAGAPGDAAEAQSEPPSPAVDHEGPAAFDSHEESPPSPPASQASQAPWVTHYKALLQQQ